MYFLKGQYPNTGKYEDICEYLSSQDRKNTKLGARDIIYSDFYQESFADFSEESEDEWLARIAECYCRNHNRVPYAEELEFWVDIHQLFSDIVYDFSMEGGSWDTELEFHLDGVIPVVSILRGTKRIAVQIVSQFECYYEDSNWKKIAETDTENTICNWDDFEKRIIEKLLNESDSNEGESWVVVLDRYFVDRDPPVETYNPITHGAYQETNVSLEQEANKELDDKAYTEPFAEKLVRLIEEHGITDSQCYRKAGVSPQVFNSYVCQYGRKERRRIPNIKTAIRFALALELPIEETDKLLKSAGLAINPSVESERVIQNEIVHGNYDIDAINEILYDKGLQTI